MDLIEEYYSAARRAGLTGVVFTEHLFRFVQAKDITDAAVETGPSGWVRESMAAYFRDHQVCDLDQYCATVELARARGLSVGVGLEIDLYADLMPEVASLLSGYRLDLRLGSVHWLDLWRFDHLEDPRSAIEWDRVDVDEVFDRYCSAVEELAESKVCDVLAHLDLIKISGRRPTHSARYEQALAATAQRHGLAVELSSAGWRKPIQEQYPSAGLLDLLAAADVPMTLASDAHEPALLGHRFGQLHRLAESAGTRLVADGWPV
jgi:histidinol-phosphatase (PHP family)